MDKSSWSSLKERRVALRREPYIFCNLAERNTAAFFYLVAPMVKGEEIVKIFVYFPRYFVSIRLYLFLAPAASISFIFVANFEYFWGFLVRNSRAFPRYKIKLPSSYHLVVNPQWDVPLSRHLVACPSPDRSYFDPKPVRVEFLLGNVTLGQCCFA